MRITWLGHACFKMEQENYTLIIDPYADGSVPGLVNMREKANQVLCSHGHGDHAGLDTVEITEGGVSPFTVTAIGTYHDEAQGAKRGNNKIHIIEAVGVRVAHLGDLGCELTEEQQAFLKQVDAMLIPVGGFYTIDGQQAGEIVRQCSPKLVIPMHYRSEEPRFGYEVLAEVKEFVQRMDCVQVMAESQIDTDNQPKVQVVVLTPQNAK